MNQGAAAVVHKLDQLININLRIEKLMEKNLSSSSKSDSSAPEPTGSKPEDVKNLTSLSAAMTPLIEAINKSSKVDKDAGKRIAKVIVDIASGVKEAANMVDNSDVKQTSDMINAIAGNVGVFMKSLAMTAIIAPLSYVGAFIFGNTIVLLTNILSRAKTLEPETTAGIQAVLDMAKGAALFGLSMVLFSLVAPRIAIGALEFSLIVSGVLFIFSRAAKLQPETAEGINAVLDMAKGAALFGVAMFLYSLVAPQIAIGALAFVAIVAGVTLVFSLLAKATKTIEMGNNSLDKMAIGVALFSLTFVLVSLVAQQVAIGALVTIAAIGGFVLVFGLLSKAFPEIEKGAESLKKMALPTAMFMGIFALVGLVAPLVALGALTSALSITFIGLSFAAVGALSKYVDPGVTAIKKMILPLLAFTGVIAVWSMIKDWDNVAKAGLTTGLLITGLGLAAYVLGLPAVFPFVELGAAALLTLSGALLVFSAALFIMSKVDISQDWADNMSYTIIELGKALGLAGLMSVGIILGSAAILVAAPALLLLSGALLAFKATKFNETDSQNVKSAIGGVVEGFSSIGILDSIGAASAAALVSVMSVGLIALSGGLMLFKKADYKQSDGENIKHAISSITTAFSDAFEELTVTKWLQISSGIVLLATMGGAIASLAEGVARMANLEVVEYEVINAGTPNAKIVPKVSRKLTPADFTNASKNISAILEAITDPLVKFGQAVDQGKSGDPLFDWFNGGYIERGLDMFEQLSSSIGSMAEGVAKMANLDVIDYIVVNAGTPDAKLVPNGSRKLTKADFTAAGDNISTILSYLAEPIASFGRDMTEGEGLFSDGYVEKGIEGLATISSSLGGLAEGVAKMANLEVQTFDIIAPGTTDAKLVPGKPRKLTTADFSNAAANIGSLLNFLAQPLSQFGEAMENGEGWFSDGYVTKGIEGLGKLTNPLSELADLIIKLGGGQIEQKDTVIDPKTKLPIFVPGKMLDFRTAMVKAKGSIIDLLYFIPTQFNAFGLKFEGMRKGIEAGILGIGKIANAMEEDVVPALERFVKAGSLYTEAMTIFQNSEKLTTKPDDLIFKFSMSMSTLGDTISKKMPPKTLGQFKFFNDQIVRLTTVVSPFERFVKAFGDMSKNMGVFAKNFSVMDVKGITAFKDWTDSMVSVSKVDITKSASIIDFVNRVVDGAFGAGKSSEKSPQDFSVADKKEAIANQAAKAAPTPAAAPAPQQQTVKIDTAAITAAIQEAFRNLSVETIKTNQIIEES
jgi:hypothetical protein